MTPRPALFVALALALPGCQQMPEPYRPPVKRDPGMHLYAFRSSAVIAMSDPDAGVYLVSDIGRADPKVPWRWCEQKPTLRVPVRTSVNQKFVIDFTLPEVTFHDTGPVTMTFFVNDQLLDRVRYLTFGEKHFEKPVPPAWLHPGAENQVAAGIDKMWISRSDGSRYGFILTRMGLAPQSP